MCLFYYRTATSLVDRIFKILTNARLLAHSIYYIEENAVKVPETIEGAFLVFNHVLIDYWILRGFAMIAFRRLQFRLLNWNSLNSLKRK